MIILIQEKNSSLTHFQSWKTKTKTKKSAPPKQTSQLACSPLFDDPFFGSSSFFQASSSVLTLPPACASALPTPRHDASHSITMFTYATGILAGLFLPSIDNGSVRPKIWFFCSKVNSLTRSRIDVCGRKSETIMHRSDMPHYTLRLAVGGSTTHATQ